MMITTAQTIESQVAAAILEKSLARLEINGKTYEIAPPTIATLILVSEIVATLPIVEKCKLEERTASVLHNARYFKALGDIAAVLILGAKRINEASHRQSCESRIKAFFSRKKQVLSEREELAQIINENLSPTTLFDVIVQRLKDNEVGVFFAITTSLSEANILKPTKEVVEG
jgi:hypothetical protein